MAANPAKKAFRGAGAALVAWRDGRAIARQGAWPRDRLGGRFAPLVDAVIGRIEQHAAEAAARGNDPAAREAFLADLRAYHEVTRNFELALPVESVSAWFRRLGAVRR